jgi:hypothetical protein
MLTTILFVILGLLALILLAAALRPADFRYERHALIAAPPAAVFSHVNELRNWLAWSPWEKYDPTMKRTFAGPAAGVGASYAWDGNNRIGAGRMTVTESRPAERIVLKLEFFRPFACTNRCEFTFASEGNSTYVTWNMTGKNNFISRVMGLFMNMDRLIGGNFEEGLGNLRRLAERSAGA